MNRRSFLGLAAAGSAALSITGRAQAGLIPPLQIENAVAEDAHLPVIEWQMATSWPADLDSIFWGAQLVANRVAALTDGRFLIRPRAAGELAPGLGVLNAVEEGDVPIGHTVSHYYTDRGFVIALNNGLPFGLTARQQNAWLYEGGGLEKLQEIHAERFNIIQFPVGNSGVQMGGWFNKEINSVSDLAGLRMRIPGIAGQVLARLGVSVQMLPGGEIFQALESGAIDAAEWVGPYEDERMGFHTVASYYYYPGWWDPGSSVEVHVNLDEWKKLPEQYREALKTAAYEVNVRVMARYDARNPVALRRLINDGGVNLRPFPDDLLKAAEETAFQLFDETAAVDADFASIFKDWLAFRDAIHAWHGLAELGYLQYVGRSR
ncbi:MAG: twin-arginine translocation signal domain-containing protein [Caldilineaceae bacterium SB0668_bin_21]|nr:twin-arginine translocation signal domain-containing protein [Caldilineaceae bacterium SB0668_bin_21]MYC21293.1 twin-arginine translocation signal domain-containing protein [Caldilineaceae bacterium SB0662_bin_25]